MPIPTKLTTQVVQMQSEREYILIQDPLGLDVFQRENQSSPLQANFLWTLSKNQILLRLPQQHRSYQISLHHLGSSVDQKSRQVSPQ